MKTKQKIINFLLFFILTVVGIALFRSGYIIVIKKQSRNPAAVPQIYDYSHLNGQDLLTAARNQILAHSKVISQPMAVGLELGHFRMKNHLGQSVSVCEIYDKIEMRFYAGNMAVSGEPPEMIVEGPCLTDDYSIAPIMIPFGEILKLPVSDIEFTNFQDIRALVYFRHVSDSWPKSWILHSIKLHNDENQDLQISKEDIRSLLRIYPELAWQ